MYIIFADVDGTIYSRDFKIHSQTLIDIELAQSKGVEFVITTANAYLDNMEFLAQKLNTRYLIASNGAAIYDRIEKEFFYKLKISQIKAKKIFDFGKNISNFVSWCDETKAYYFSNQGYEKQAIENISKFWTKKHNFKQANEINQDIFKIEFIGDKEAINKIIAQAKKLDFNIVKIKNNYVELTNANVSKGSAVKLLTNHLETSLENVMTIGDSKNDHAMLKITDHSYAMANGINATKKIAKRHTSSVEQNGLGEAIVDFLFRNKII